MLGFNGINNIGIIIWLLKCIMISIMIGIVIQDHPPITPVSDYDYGQYGVQGGAPSYKLVYKPH